MHFAREKQESAFLVRRCDTGRVRRWRAVLRRMTQDREEFVQLCSRPASERSGRHSFAVEPRESIPRVHGPVRQPERLIWRVGLIQHPAGGDARGKARAGYARHKKNFCMSGPSRASLRRSPMCFRRTNVLPQDRRQTKLKPSLALPAKTDRPLSSSRPRCTALSGLLGAFGEAPGDGLHVDRAHERGRPTTGVIAGTEYAGRNALSTSRPIFQSLQIG